MTCDVTPTDPIRQRHANVTRIRYDTRVIEFRLSEISYLLPVPQLPPMTIFLEISDAIFIMEYFFDVPSMHQSCMDDRWTQSDYYLNENIEMHLNLLGRWVLKGLKYLLPLQMLTLGGNLVNPIVYLLLFLGLACWSSG